MYLEVLSYLLDAFMFLSTCVALTAMWNPKVYPSSSYLVIWLDFFYPLIAANKYETSVFTPKSHPI